MVMEFEEFGEFEREIEHGGEILLEQFHITKQFIPEFGLRAGQIVIPVGMTNRHHRPEDYLGSVRPEADESLLPVAWTENGLMLLGNISGLQFRAGVVNGLSSAGFSSKFWIREGRQGAFEFTRADDLALFVHAEYELLDGLIIGGSAYRGNTTGNRPKDDMKGIDAHVTIAEVHAIYAANNVTARTMFLHGSLQNADRVSARSSRLSAALEVPRTPVGSGAQIFSIEAGYDRMPLILQAPDDLRLLLHDMGPDLADGRPDYLASGTEWRTPPLWGLGLTRLVHGEYRLMHDDRAESFSEAIKWLGGEAEQSREFFADLPREDRLAMIAYLESL